MGRSSNLALAYDDLDLASPESKANPALTSHRKDVMGSVLLNKPLLQSDAYTFVLGTSIVMTGMISQAPTLGNIENLQIITEPLYLGNVDPFLLAQTKNSIVLTSYQDAERRVAVAKVMRPTAEARRQLETLEDLSHGWNDDSPVPNEESIRVAGKILDVLDEIPLIPRRVVPDAEGGVSIYFFGGKTLSGGAQQRYASISSSNEGEIVALVHDRDDEPRAWNVDSQRAALQDAAIRIRRFIAT